METPPLLLVSSQLVTQISTPIISTSDSVSPETLKRMIFSTQIAHDRFLALWPLDGFHTDMNTAQSEDMDLDHEDLFLDFPGPRTLCCTSCREKIKCVTKLKEHFQEHTFPMINPLDTTDYSKPKLAGSSEHMSPCQLARFQCSKCPASFTLKSNMEQHGKKTKHFNWKKMQCPHCLKLFRDKTDLNRRLISVHSS